MRNPSANIIVTITLLKHSSEKPGHTKPSDRVPSLFLKILSDGLPLCLCFLAIIGDLYLLQVIDTFASNNDGNVIL